MPVVYEAADILEPPEAGEAMGLVRPFVASHDADDRRNYLPALGLFGTAGNPDLVYDWRADQIPVISEQLALRGLAERVNIFNPLKREWKPEDAAEEARHLARDAAVVLPVLDITTGHASLAETGFAALGGTLRPQRVHMFIESGSDHDDAVKRARTLTTLLATKTLKDFPVNAAMAPDMQTMIDNGVRDVSDFADRVASRVSHDSRFTIPRRTDLSPTIALVGSGASRYDGSWYEGMRDRLDDNGVARREQYSAYTDDWTLDNAITELEHKTNDAVILFAATETENSFGALGELGWLLAYCAFNGQKLGVYVEKHDSDPKSDQNRQRKLAMAHLGRHLLDFPDLPVFIASTPAELARYGASELAKYKQLQRASQIALQSQSS
ncbi:MAG: hypothetical protein JWN38_595 [Candidatus Saccharibacteria bacterium]|nr:hypothetical protein [Candidatus Saccharibacteria bacterium]